MNLFRKFSIPSVSTTSLSGVDLVAETNMKNDIENIKEFEKKRANIAKEIKSLFDTMHMLCNDERRLVDEMSTFTGFSNSQLQANVIAWKQFIDDIGKNRQDFVKLLRQTSLDPLMKFETGFREMKLAIKRYEELLDKTRRLNQKVIKYKESERTAKNIVKLNEYEENLKTSQTELSDIRVLLDKELNKFLRFRLDYMQPSVSAFISAEILSSGNSFKALDGFEHLGIGDEISVADQAAQDSLFAEIDKLKIVGA